MRTVRREDYRTRAEYRWAKKQANREAMRRTRVGYWLISLLCFATLPLTHSLAINAIAWVVLQVTYGVAKNLKP
jgi:hypothetical protein